MTTLPLGNVPFSTFGSWLSTAYLVAERAPGGAEGLYLRSHHGGAKALCRLVPLRNGEPAKLEVRAEPTHLYWLGEAGETLELLFGTPQSLRLRGSGLGLRLMPALTGTLPTVAYRTDENLVTLNVHEARRRYALETLSGRLTLRGAWQAQPEVGSGAEIQVDLLPGESGAWEAALDEMTSTWIQPRRERFETCLEIAETSFRRWLERLPQAPPNWHEARRLAGYVNWASTVSSKGLLRRPAVLMSKNWMDNVWSWDHCFNALALAPGHAELAWDQMLLMVDHQDSFGSYPDAINDEQVSYNFSKPPIHGWAVRELLKRSAPPIGILGTLYTSLARWTQWWLTHRVLPGQTLPHYLHGNDSGWDNSTMFDMGVPLIAPDLAAFLVTQLEVLSELAPHVGRSDESQAWAERASILQTALLEELWTGERFVAKLALTGDIVASSSLQYCLPILLGQRLPPKVRESLVKQLEPFVTEHGLATEQPQSDAYLSDGYWRGPVWAPSTYLVVKGLEASGYGELAERIASRFCETCAAQGFAENFDALTGRGYRDRAYTWTASAFLLLASL